MAPGELAQLLGTDPSTGEVVPIGASVLSRAVAAAKAAGLIGRHSRTRCLLLPYPGIWQGPGSDSDPCPVHRDDGSAARRAAEAAWRRAKVGNVTEARDTWLRLYAQRSTFDEWTPDSKKLTA